MSKENMNGQPSFPPYGYPPHYCPPHYMMGQPHMGYPHPGYPPHPHMPHPHMPHHAYPYGYPEMQPQAQPAAQAEQADPVAQQAQQMVEGMMGEQAGMFKEIVGKLGIDDREFWKGAMIGAAAAMVVSNPAIKEMLMGMLSGAGELFKSAMPDNAPEQASSMTDGAADE